MTTVEAKQMEITKRNVEKIVLTKLDRLDPVTIIAEDLGQGRGSLTITCFGKAWTSYWGGIGDQTISEFITKCHIDYLADRLTTTPASDIDYEAISERIGECVDVTSAMCFSDKLAEAYGPDWYMDLPTCPNPDYSYLCRIITAVKEGLATDLQQQRTNK